MDKKHRKLLLKHRLEFVKDLDPNDVTGYLFQERVITENDKEAIEGFSTRREQVEYLMDLLPRKGPKAFKKFFLILFELNVYKHLAMLISDGGTFLKEAKAPLDEIDARQDILVRPRSSSRRKSAMLDVYPYNTSSKGWCFILNNSTFDFMGNRPGSDKDAVDLKKLFEKLSFKVWVVNNADADKIREKFTELARKPDHENNLVVCILSHGLTGQIYGTDSELISVSEILNILGNGTEKLRKLPKLFLIQACRIPKKQKTPSRPASSTFSEVVTRPDSKTLDSGEQERFEPFIKEHEKPMQSDLLLGYSTFPGEVSWRHSKQGSYFIASIIEVFSEYATSEDVASMMIKVNQLVKNKLAERGESQIPAPVVTLTKYLYLFSG